MGGRVFLTLFEKSIPPMIALHNFSRTFLLKARAEAIAYNQPELKAS
jgi:hypothetical protein